MATTPRQILLRITEHFPQADPASEFYDEPINGCEAVNYISEIVPEIREVLDAQVSESDTIKELLQACIQARAALPDAWAAVKCDVPREVIDLLNSAIARAQSSLSTIG